MTTNGHQLLARFPGKTAFVTGGASGIGAATARRLASEGAIVVVGDCDLEGARVVAKEVAGLAVELDVADEASVAVAFDTATNQCGPVDVLVNNAGIDQMSMFLEISPEAWARVLAVNLEGTMACTHAVLRAMHERRSGAIVNVASEAGVVGTVGGAVYAASKGGVIAFTKSIARESARYGVRCNSVAPGPIDTPLLNGAAEAYGDRGAFLKQAIVESTVMRRMGQPEEVAAAIAFLASDDASFVTGHTLAVSGGVSMQ